ncbi:hypothetical protein B4U84_23425 [Westiellopsis prolifica IICB1]|nr:hypothetical protein B4U84_23425 [Westiellopsis prolifica IICB1]
MSQNNDYETDKKDLLGKASVLLGIVATALGILISLRTHIISEQTQNILAKINELEVINKDLNNKFKKLEIVQKSQEIEKSKSRIEKEFLVLNAKVLANRIDAKNVRIIWPDQEIQNDMMSFVRFWRGANKLMLGSSQKGLFLRQVVCLRLINYGGTPARNVVVTISKKNFNNSDTGDVLEQPYYKINTSGWAEKNISIQDLMEKDFEDKLKTEILIPLAHISRRDDGYFRYFGSMAVPVKVTWYDNQNVPEKPYSFQINVSQESILKSDLDFILGTSEY